MANYLVSNYPAGVTAFDYEQAMCVERTGPCEGCKGTGWICEMCAKNRLGCVCEEFDAMLCKECGGSGR